MADEPKPSLLGKIKSLAAAVVPTAAPAPAPVPEPAVAPVVAPEAAPAPEVTLTSATADAEFLWTDADEAVEETPAAPPAPAPEPVIDDVDLASAEAAEAEEEIDHSDLAIAALLRALTERYAGGKFTAAKAAKAAKRVGKRYPDLAVGLESLTSTAPTDQVIVENLVSLVGDIFELGDTAYALERHIAEREVVVGRNKRPRTNPETNLRDVRFSVSMSPV